MLFHLLTLAAALDVTTGEKHEGNAGLRVDSSSVKDTGMQEHDFAATSKAQVIREILGARPRDSTKYYQTDRCRCDRCNEDLCSTARVCPTCQRRCMGTHLFSAGDFWGAAIDRHPDGEFVVHADMEAHAAEAVSGYDGCMSAPGCNSFAGFVDLSAPTEALVEQLHNEASAPPCDQPGQKCCVCDDCNNDSCTDAGACDRCAGVCWSEVDASASNADKLASFAACMTEADGPNARGCQRAPYGYVFSPHLGLGQ